MTKDTRIKILTHNVESRTYTTSINQCKFAKLYLKKVLTAKDLFIDLDLQEPFKPKPPKKL